MQLLKKGTPVSWPVPVTAGTIERSRIIDDEIQYLVNYTDAAGEAQQRYFRAEELTVTGEPT